MRKPVQDSQRRAIDWIGGEEALRKLVNDFYDIIETHPRGARILDLHFQGHGMNHVRAEQFDFMSGLLGGQRYYEENHGHMDLREIHAHVPIRVEDAEDWLFCMDEALKKNDLMGDQADHLRASLRRMCMILVNDGEVNSVLKK